MLGRTGQQIHQQTDRMAKTAGNNWAQQFTKTGQVDPSRLVNTAQFAQHGHKAGRAMGDSAADAVKRGDWQGAARDSARSFEVAFEKLAKPKATVDTSGMQREGGSAGDSFASGFGSAGGLTKLAGKGGPIATAIIGGVAAALAVVQPMVSEAMRIDAEISLAGARGGLNQKQLAEYRKMATEAWGRNSGASIEANVSTAVTAMQAGLGADQATIESLNTVSSILGEEIPAAARSAGQLIRTGLAENAKQAFDILVAGQQNGLNVSQDWLDTIDEYSTQFRALGLSGADSIGLLNQMVRAGARNTDVAADALKELAIRAQDGSKSTTDAFNRLGLNAAEMAGRISAGGETARTAFDQILDAIRNTKDPVAQMQIAVALLGTKAEDLGDAFKAIDLTTAANSIRDVEGAAQSAADTALRTSQSEWAQAGRNIQKVWQDVKDSLDLGDWFSQIPKSFNELFGDRPQLTPGAPGVPIFSGPGPAITPPGAPGGNLNPLDVITGQHAGGRPAAPAAPAPGPAPGMWWGPNMTRPVENPRFGSQYDRDHSTSSGPGQTGPVVPFAGDPMSLLQGLPVTSSLYSSANSLLEAQNKVQQEIAELNALLRDNTATADHINKARNEVADAERQRFQAELALNEQKRSATEAFTSTMEGATSAIGDIGAALDSDLGISKGLPGLADNLVRFLANLATAPLQGILSQIANPGGTSQAGAMQSFVPYGMPSYDAGYPGDAALLANVRPGVYSQSPERDLLQGLSDCSSSIGDLVNILDGKPTGPAGGERLTTHNAAQWLQSRGFVPGVGGPGDFRVGFNPSHMQATLPGGTNWNWGSDAAAAAAGRTGLGAADPSLTQQYYRPAATMPTGAPSTPWIPQAGNSGGLVIPPPLSSAAANANPALTNPALTSGLPAPGTVPTGGPLSSGFPNAFSASYAPTTPSEQAAPSWQPQGGGNLGSGFLGMAMGLASGAAGMGANMFAPGSGAAAQAAADMAQKAIQRTIAFGGQAAGIGMQGLMETFGVSDPDGGGNGLGVSWLQRVAGGLAGMKLAGGQGAGKQDQNSKVDPNAPQNQQGQPGQSGMPGQPGQGGPQGPTVHIEHFVQAENRNGQQAAQDLAYQTQSAQMNPGG